MFYLKTMSVHLFHILNDCYFIALLLRETLKNSKSNPKKSGAVTHFFLFISNFTFALLIALNLECCFGRV